jgi:hypothetical protein
MLGKYYHFGGLHVGSAVAGTIWYLALVVSVMCDAGAVSYAHTVITTIVTVFAVMIVMALPRLRAARHDRFEVTHRFCGWVALVLVWVNTMLFVNGDRGDASLAAALLGAPSFWLVALTAGLAIWPWLLLRRVPITCQRPSSHAVILRLDHGVTPAVGTTRPISRHPFVGSLASARHRKVRFDLRGRPPVSCSVGVRKARGLGSMSVAENHPAVDA